MRLRKPRQPIGRLEPDELVVHRELEYLRAAGSLTSSDARSERGTRYLDRKLEGLQEAQAIAARHGKAARR